MIRARRRPRREAHHRDSATALTGFGIRRLQYFCSNFTFFSVSLAASYLASIFKSCAAAVFMPAFRSTAVRLSYLRVG
jgi:hypothetical protein